MTPESPTVAVSTPESTRKAESAFATHRSWKIAAVVAAVMILLALLGVGLTTGSRSSAPTYWISLVPMYGILCIWMAWVRAREGGTFDRAVILRQILHWLGVGVALALTFFIRGTGEISGIGSGEIALLLLALGCYLAGIHLQALFVLVGMLLTLTLVFITEVDQYLWVFFVVGILSILAIIALTWAVGVRRRAKVLAAQAGS